MRHLAFRAGLVLAELTLAQVVLVQHAIAQHLGVTSGVGANDENATENQSALPGLVQVGGARLREGRIAGAVALGLLLYFRPLDRLQALVADSTYVTLVKDSFQYQVALRLIALDTDDARSVEAAAAYVGEAAQASMDLVYTQMQARRAAGFSASSN